MTHGRKRKYICIKPNFIVKLFALFCKKKKCGEIIKCVLVTIKKGDVYTNLVQSVLGFMSLFATAYVCEIGIR